MAAGKPLACAVEDFTGESDIAMEFGGWRSLATLTVAQNPNATFAAKPGRDGAGLVLRPSGLS